jgi:hypothetical protein
MHASATLLLKNQRHYASRVSRQRQLSIDCNASHRTGRFARVFQTDPTSIRIATFSARFFCNHGIPLVPGGFTRPLGRSPMFLDFIRVNSFGVAGWGNADPGAANRISDLL